ncbi:MAG: DUF6125 family protein [Candidatus Hermodarchaeota archaeon]
MNFDEFTREDLIKIIRMFAKNWLAHDGCWFLAAEKKYGIDTAIELDTLSWEQFTVIEAKRIMETFELPKNGGLETLKRALGLRLYASINIQEIEEFEHHIIFRMKECRVQSARKRKGLPDFPCKSVGLVEYTGFAKTIDPRIKTECIACPPDPHPEDFYCAWRFSIEHSSIS